MRMRTLVPALVCVVLAGLVAVPPPADGADGAEGAKIDKLIEQMGSTSFEEREKATEALDALGEPALEALRKATRSSDAEVRKRATDLLSRLEKRLESARHLAPKLVHLKYKNTPLSEAVADFRKQSGYNVVLADPEGKLRDRKITLDTGKVTFWAALEQFCTKAGLGEYDPDTSFPGGVPFPAGRAIPMPRPAPLPPGVLPAVPVPAPKGFGAAGVAAPAVAVFEVKVEAKPAPAAPAPPAVPAVPAVKPLPALAPRAMFALDLIAEAGPDTTGQITLMEGRAKFSPSDSSSAVRVSAQADSKMFGASTEKQIVLALRLSPEPKLQWQNTTAVRIDQAVDDNGQKLTMADAPVDPLGPGGPGAFPGGGGRVIILPGGGAAMPGFIGRSWNPYAASHQYYPLRLNRGEKAAKEIKVLEGTVTAEVLGASQALITAEDVLKSAGKEFKGKEGGKIRITSAEKKEGHTVITFELEQPAGVVADSSQPANVAPALILPPAARPLIRPGIRLVPGKVAPGGGPAPGPAVAPVAPEGKPAVDRPAVAPEGKPGTAKPGIGPSGKPEGKPVPGKPEEKPEDKPALKPAAGGPAPAPAPAVVIGVQMGPAGGFATSYAPTSGVTLRDDKDNVLPANIQTTIKRGVGRISMEYQVIFISQKGLGEPAKLVFSGRKPVQLNIPFTIKDIKLP